GGAGGAARQPQNRGGDAPFLVRHDDGGELPPRRQALRGPGERAIEVAEVAGVRPAGLEAPRRTRAVDAMATDRLQQAEGGVRHVAVVAAAALARRRVVRVRRALRPDVVVTGGAAAVVLL